MTKMPTISDVSRHEAVESVAGLPGGGYEINLAVGWWLPVGGDDVDPQATTVFQARDALAALSRLDDVYQVDN